MRTLYTNNPKMRVQVIKNIVYRYYFKEKRKNTIKNLNEYSI